MKKIMLLMVMLIAVLMAVPVMSIAFTCGGGTCESSESCCDNSVCCPSGMNLYCSSSNTCYSSISAAKKDCGESYTVCASPAAGKKQESIIELAGICPREETIKNEGLTRKSLQLYDAVN